MYALV
jgi:hypothetical protein